MCTALLPPGGNPIAVKYILSYIHLQAHPKDVETVTIKHYTEWVRTGKKTDVNLLNITQHKT